MVNDLEQLSANFLDSEEAECRLDSLQFMINPDLDAQTRLEDETREMAAIALFYESNVEILKILEKVYSDGNRKKILNRGIGPIISLKGAILDYHGERGNLPNEVQLTAIARTYLFMDPSHAPPAHTGLTERQRHALQKTNS